MKIFLFVCSIFSFLVLGCTASSPTPEKSPQYQEIQPGEKSLITPPELTPKNNASPVKEKSI